MAWKRMKIIRKQDLSARLILKYLLFQVPGLLVVAFLLWALHAFAEVSPTPLFVLFALWGLKDLLLFPFTASAYQDRGQSPLDLEGGTGEARSRIAPTGTIFARGTLWTARLQPGQREIEAGEKIRIVGREGLTLEVAPMDGNG